MTTPFGSPHSESELDSELSAEESSELHAEESPATVSHKREPISSAEREYSGLRSEEKEPNVVCTSP